MVSFSLTRIKTKSSLVFKITLRVKACMHAFLCMCVTDDMLCLLSWLCGFMTHAMNFLPAFSRSVPEVHRVLPVDVLSVSRCLAWEVSWRFTECWATGVCLVVGCSGVLGFPRVLSCRCLSPCLVLQERRAGSAPERGAGRPWWVPLAAGAVYTAHLLSPVLLSVERSQNYRQGMFVESLSTSLTAIYLYVCL